MKAPKFSVIIPAFNSAETIGCAIQSVLDQYYPPHEIIVVDDGSTDDTAKVVANFGKHVTYLHQPNAGVSSARNAAARAARGDWLAFLDADDWYYPDRLGLHADWIKEDPKLDFLTGDQEYRRPNGALIKQSLESTVAGRRILERANGQPRAMLEQRDLADFVEDHFGDTPTLSVPLTTFQELGGYPVGYRVCEDVHFLIRLCARSQRIGVICRPLAVYCVRPDSATRKDVLNAQEQTVAALVSLKGLLSEAAPPVREGLERALRRARRDLATVLLRRRRHAAAVRAVLSSFLEKPAWGTLRDVLSIARGVRAADPHGR